MYRYLLFIGFVLAALPTGAAHALDKVDPYICPTQLHGSGFDCFLEAVPQTYTMCRQIKSIEIIEFGLTGAQEGVNGAKTEYCIDKHRLTITRPYQAALRESASNKDTVKDLSKLYETWLASLAQLVPTAGETDDAYKQRVMRPYSEFSEQIKSIRKVAAAPAAPAAAKSGSKSKKKTDK
jgi:hypothetical protein